MQNTVFFPRADNGNGLIHGLGRRGGGRNGNFRRVFEKDVSQAADFRRHGGGEEQGLAFRIAKLHDAFDIRDEAHVQHTVGLVDHQHIDTAQQQPAALKMIEQTSGRGDQDIRAAIDNPALIHKRDTANQQRHVQFVIFAIDLEVLGHLGGQLPGRLQDQGTGHARPGPALGEDIDHGQREASGLACSGLGAAQDITPLQDVGNSALLNGRGFAVAGIIDGLQDGSAKAKFFEGHVIP